MAYNTDHVVRAINVHCPPILKRRSGGFVALENIVPDLEQKQKLQSGGYGAVAVYDQGTHHLHTADKDSNLHNVVKNLRQLVDVERI